MAESVYKVIEIVGASSESWEKAAKAAVERAAETLRDLRVAEVVEQDLQLQGRQGRILSDQAQDLVQIRGRARLRSSTAFAIESDSELARPSIRATSKRRRARSRRDGLSCAEATRMRSKRRRGGLALSSLRSMSARTSDLGVKAWIQANPPSTALRPSTRRWPLKTEFTTTRPRAVSVFAAASCRGRGLRLYGSHAGRALWRGLARARRHGVPVPQTRL